MHDPFDNLLPGAANVQRPMDMNLQLRSGIADGCQRSNNSDFTRFKIEAGTRIDVTERKFDQQSGKVRCDIFQTLNDAFAGFPVNFG